jgi:hypothetical protein
MLSTVSSSRRGTRLGRNDPCFCGSGKKFKRCHGGQAITPPQLRAVPPEVLRFIEEHKARELRREQQQGLGRPIISTDFQGYRIVAVGSAVHWGKWKTFFDFLSDYIGSALGSDWGNAEIAKPLTQRHPIMQWYDAVCHYQQKTILEPGKVHTAPMTGATAAYFGLAYNLYLLAHNVELHRRLVARLKNQDQFQGAYYETLVAAWFILSGFELTLENESDVSDSHCEFNAKRKQTDAVYSVEAKSRGPNKEHLDVGTQLARALHKTAAHQRIVMIDVNVPNDPQRAADVWLNGVMGALQRREPTLTVNGQPAPPAFVVVTNHPYHYDLEGPIGGMAVLAGGFKIPEFGLGGRLTTVRKAFETKQKYADIFALVNAIRNYRVPSTFDGELAEFAFGEAERKWKIGERYDLPDAEPRATGVLTAATVSTAEKVVYLVFQLDDGRSIIMTAPMTDAEISAYEVHPDTFFGVVRSVGKRLENPLELFEWLYESYRNTPRERILEFAANWSDAGELAKVSDEELLLTYVERMVGATIVGSSSS